MVHRPLCVPATPPGITLFSLAVATHLLSGNASKKATLLHLFGRRDASIVSCFSASVCLAQSRGTLGEGAALLKQSGLFGLYACAMPSARAEIWLQALRRGASARPNPQQFATGMAQQRLLKRVMHCCPQCMEEDASRFGLAFWYTVHQLPGVHHCPVHRLALHGACLNCGRSQGAEHAWHLPASSCPHCGGGRFAKEDPIRSLGYSRHLTLVSRAVLGDFELLEPDVRSRLYANAFRPDDGGDSRQVADGLLDMWRCSTLDELSTMLGAQVTPKFIDTAIHGGYNGVNPLAHLALISLAKSLLDARGGTPARRSGQPDAGRGRLPLAGLEAALEASGLPLDFAGQLASGYSMTRLSAGSGIPYPRLRRQLGQVFRWDIDELHFASPDDLESDRVRANLLALAEKLRGPRRHNNVFHQQNRAAGFEELRLLNRSKVQRYLEQGISTRKELHYKNSGLGDWCRAYDAVWFDAVLPAIPQAQRKRIGRRKGKLAPVPPSEADTTERLVGEHGQIPQELRPRLSD